MSSSEQYKRQIMNDLAGVILNEDAPFEGREYENFDDFAQRSSHNERRRCLVALYIQIVFLPARWSQNCFMHPKSSLRNEDDAFSST